MDGDLSGLFGIRTDHVVGVNPKNRQRQKNGRPFDSHLKRDEEAAREDGAEAETEDRPGKADPDSRPHPSLRRPAARGCGKVIDYEA